MQGSILDSRYLIIKYIAKSGFSKVYLAVDIQSPNKDKCLLKQLHPQVNEPNFLEVAQKLFKTKAEEINALEKQNQIPKMLAYFEEDQKSYLVQEYRENQTFNQEIIPGQSWSEDDVVELLQDCINIFNFVQAKNLMKSRVKRSPKKPAMVDFGTVKEIFSALAGLGNILAIVSRVQATHNTSALNTSISSTQNDHSSTKEQRRQAFDTAKQAAKNQIKRSLSQKNYDFNFARESKQLWQKVNTEYQQFTNVFDRNLIETRQHNHGDVRNEISQIFPKWNSLEHKTQKVTSKNLKWRDRSNKITTHFNVGELIGNSNPPKTAEEKENLIKVAQLVQNIRNEWGSAIVITSAYRDREYNAKIGGAVNSQHILGKAADICPANGNLMKFHKWLYERRDEFGIGGFGHGQHRGFVHVDIGDRREWNY